jgi:hypothetical protein
MADAEGSGAGDALAALGKGFGGRFGGDGGRDGSDFGDESEGGAGGMGGGDVAAILQTISANLEKLLDIAGARGLTPDGGKEGPGIPGASDAMQGAQKIVDTLESGKAIIGAVDTTIQWARTSLAVVEGIMAAAAM